MIEPNCLMSTTVGAHASIPQVDIVQLARLALAAMDKGFNIAITGLQIDEVELTECLDPENWLPKPVFLRLLSKQDCYPVAESISLALRSNLTVVLTSNQSMAQLKNEHGANELLRLLRENFILIEMARPYASIERDISPFSRLQNSTAADPR